MPNADVQLIKRRLKVAEEDNARRFGKESRR